MHPNLCQQIFAQTYRDLRHGPVPEIQVEFYPYANLNHTIRSRNNRLLVRLSDIAGDAPEEVIHALAHILLGKILRRKTPPRFHEIYRDYARSPAVSADIAHTRAERARPSQGLSEGRHSDLKVLFDRLNERFFSGKLQGVRLIWSLRRSWRRLGYYRQALNTIVISKALDDPRVPGYVREFILYHEMLHAATPTVVRNGRRYDHTPAFRSAEKQFPEFEKADYYLRRWPPRELRRQPRLVSRPMQRSLF